MEQVNCFFKQTDNERLLPYILYSRGKKVKIGIRNQYNVFCPAG